MTDVTGIILAAGEGSRMGAVKQMLPYKGKTILQWVIDNAVASSLHRVVVVIGYQAEMIEPLLKGKDITVVINSDYQTGQGSSIKAGMRALPEGTEAVLFLLGDQPLVVPETINRIVNAYLETQSAIVIPECCGKRGNPVLFSRETFQHLVTLAGDCGARALFDEYPGQILQVQIDDPSIHFDVDTAEDYQQLLGLDSRRRRP